MSWDYDTYTKPCSCGKGLIEVVYGSNDWGQTSHDETILCPVCKEKAEREAAEKQERKRVANQKINIALDYFKEKYFDIVFSKFENTKSKKDIWKVASAIGLETYSESSFYKHTKSQAIVIENYVANNIRWSNLRKIIKSLVINDTKLTDLIDDAESHNKEFDDERAVANYMYYKGRI